MLKFLGINWHEPSTWRGIVYLVSAAGVTISPEQQGAIVSAGLAVAGAIGLFIKDKPAQ